MLILTNPGTADKVRLVTSSTAPIDVHSSYIDATTASPPVPDPPGRQNTAIVTATTTDIVAGPASGKFRNVKTIHIRNKSTTANNDVTVTYDIGGTAYEIVKATLKPGDQLEYVEGIGWYTIAGAAVLTNASTASVSASFAADTYVVGSSITMPSGSPTAKALYICTFDMTKTAAGVATPIINLRYGTAGTTSDTSRGTHTFSAGTAAIDTGIFTVRALFRTVGSGAAAVLASSVQLDSQPTTGLSSLIHATTAISAGFDSTVAGSILGVSFNGGASFSGTVTVVEAQLVQR
jgi:hypothetical protein